MATLNSIDLGVVKSENSTKDSNLFFFPMPMSDSDEAFLIDLMGTSRTINLTGEFVGAKATITTSINSIEALMNGEQESVEFDGEILTGKNVLIQSFNWDYKEGDPNRITYNLTLLEGAI